MIDSSIFISILAFAGVVLLILGLYFYAGHRKERREFVQRIRESGEERPAAEEPELSRTMKSQFIKALGSLGRLIKPGSEGENPSYIRKMFFRAGLRGQNAPLLFFGCKALLGILLPLLFSLIKFSLLPTLQSLHFMGLAMLGALAGFYLPNLWLRMAIEQRKEKILLGLPDALDLMVVCAEAGVGLDAAIQRVGEEMRLSNKPLSDEFKVMSLELRAGKQRREALKALAVRTDLEDVNNLSSLLIQTERFGTSIAQALRVHSDSMRVKRFQRAEEVASKLPVKLLFPMILFIFPSLFIAILGPAAIRIFRTLLPTLGGH